MQRTPQISENTCILHRACRIYLENFWYYDEGLKGLSTKTRVIRPVPKYFVSIKDGTLNDTGAEKLYNFILQYAGKPFDGAPWEDFPLALEDPHSMDSKYPGKSRYYEGQMQGYVVPDVPVQRPGDTLIHVSPQEQEWYEYYGKCNR